jgi:hypothetical protein
MTLILIRESHLNWQASEDLKGIISDIVFQ